jgi:hypothetical protein
VPFPAPARRGGEDLDEVAIVDHGKVVVQGSIAELAAGEADDSIATSDEEQAPTMLRPSRSQVRDCGSQRTRVTLSANSVEAGRHQPRLVLAGLAIRRFEPGARIAEQRFLEITSRLEEAA